MVCIKIRTVGAIKKTAVCRQMYETRRALKEAWKYTPKCPLNEYILCRNYGTLLKKRIWLVPYCRCFKKRGGAHYQLVFCAKLIYLRSISVFCIFVHGMGLFLLLKSLNLLWMRHDMKQMLQSLLSVVIEKKRKKLQEIQNLSSL